MATPFGPLAHLSLELRRTSKRLAAMAHIGAFLRTLAPEEVRPGVMLLLGRVRPKGDPRPLEVSGATLWRAVRALTSTDARDPHLGRQEDVGVGVRTVLEAGGHPFSPTPALGLLEVHALLSALADVAGTGAAARRQALLTDLLRRATADEVEVLARIIVGDMRQGANEGVVLEAIGRLPDIGPARASRARMLLGDVSHVAEIALGEGAEGLDRLGVAYFRPLSPMLAQKAETAAEALAMCAGTASFEHKLDGARLQIHLQGDTVRLFTRRMTEVTDSLPDVVSAAREALRLREGIAEGEVVPVDVQGRVLPFQELMRRFRRVHEVDAQAAEIGTRLYLFDLLAADGEVLLDAPQRVRWARLTEVLEPHPSAVLVPHLHTSDPQAATAFYEDAVQRGQEGIMAKSPESPYTPGQRGRAWLKIKKVHTLDVVVVAADWGYGRRRGWLSNYHLAVRGDDGWVEVGKTFKGVSDAELETLTTRLSALHEGSLEDATVRVRPAVVLEVAYSDVQRSPQYAGGVALRFARVVRIRDDKTADEADTLATVQAQLARQAAADL